ALSRQTGSTLFMTLMAAFATLLYRYSGQSDVVIGSPIANRNRSEIEPLIGFFVNTLVLRTQLEADLSFEQLLTQVRETTLTAYEHQDVPFEQIVEALQPQRSMSHSPLFQVMFALQNTPMGDVELPGVRLSGLNANSTIAKFDLTLSMAETPLGLECEWEYNTDLFDKSTIERMASHFENLLSAIAVNPRQAVSELPLLSATERQQLLVDWNDTQVDYPQDKCIHQLFEEQVAKTPDAIAVVFEQQELTYRQLNHRANQLAHHLQTLGVKHEVMVGICVERSLEMVVGLLGILKAGGAYVPLDPSYPTERLSYMVSDAGIEVLLTQQNLLPTLPSHLAQVVCLDPDGGVIESHSPENLVSSVSADNLAYVIYTSGSTGAPKGVCVAHRSVVRLVQNTNYAQFNAEQVFLQLAPITFDASTLELWGSLLHGSKLVIFPSQVPDLDRLVDVVSQHQITCLWLTAGLFHLMVDEYLEALSPVQQLLAGGDVLSVDHVRRFRQRYPNCRLIDGYGPTENTTFTCCYEIGQTQLQQTVPIGKPIANTQVYILDPQLQPVPVGVTGELHIGGDGLARGYLNRPELTASKFIPNPFSSDKSARLYKTGDLARYLNDGNIEFLGRLDHQVKIRGFRIELGEIEAVISQHPQVSQVVAIDREDISGNQQLVAYVIAQSGAEISSTEIKDFVKEKIPSYMVPGAVICLDSLPLTPNGKVDRQALPQPDMSSMSSGDFVPPRTHTEAVLAEIWQKILKVEKISVRDNFFDLGGHSLLATQLSSQISEALNVKLPLKSLFEASTLASLAEEIDNISLALQAFQNHSVTSTATDLEEKGIL
ncbi:non-ribosomal peptide synthetase, partial [Chamaesiphon polymorphus]